MNVRESWLYTLTLRVWPEVGDMDDRMCQSGGHNTNFPGVAQTGGDEQLMYIDGVADAQDNTETLYDDHRLLAAARANLDRSAGEIKEAIIQSINEFVGDAPQFDDNILLVAVWK